MKKEEKPASQSSQPRLVYRYQLEQTNQILRETIDLCRSSFSNTFQTNTQHTTAIEEQDARSLHWQGFGKLFGNSPQTIQKGMAQKDQPLEDFGRLGRQTRPRQESLQDQRNSFRELKYEKEEERPQKDGCLELEQLLNERIFTYSSQGEDIGRLKSQGIFEKDMGVKSSGMRDRAGQREGSRRGRGLSQISVRVRTIVSRLSSLSFKQISQQVLRQCLSFLPSNAEQRQREMRNIRRRVYDALNVLVSAGILAKKGKMVLDSQEGEQTGRRQQEHGQIMAEKRRVLGEMESNYRSKVQNLQMLRQKAEGIRLLHERNRSLNQGQDQRFGESMQPIQTDRAEGCHRFSFPLWTVTAPTTLGKISVHIQQQKGRMVKCHLGVGPQHLRSELQLLDFLSLQPQMSLRVGPTPSLQYPCSILRLGPTLSI